MSENIQLVKLGQLLNITTGKLDVNTSSENGIYPFFTCAKKIYKINTYAFDDEAVLVAGNGDLNVKYYNGKFNAYQRTYVLTAKNNEISIKYLYFFMQTYIQKLRDKSIGGVIKYIKLGNLTDAKIPILPLEDQQKIAQQLTKIEELINKRQETIKLLDELIKSTFLDMFGDPFNNKRSFEKCTIRNLVHEVKYGTSSPSIEGGKYPYLRMNNIDYNGYWDFNDIKNIDVNDQDKEKYLIKRGDLIFNRTNSKELVGKAAVYNLDTEMVIAGYLIRIRANQENNPWFIWGYLNSIIGKKVLFNMCRNIVGMANINAQELQNILILKPPKPLQDKFADTVARIQQAKNIYKSSLDDLNHLFGAIAQKAFKGELDVSKIHLDITKQKDANVTLKLTKDNLIQEIKSGNFKIDNFINKDQHYYDVRDMLFKMLEDDLITQEVDDVEEINPETDKLEKRKKVKLACKVKE